VVTQLTSQSVPAPDDEAVRAFIADMNLERRDLKKAQKAMAFAVLYPKPNHGGKRERGAVSEVESARQRKMRQTS
jgi:hypothetical protein